MAKQSLASRKEVVPVESNPGTGLPVGFGGVLPQEPVVTTWIFCPYVLFVSPKGQTFAKIARHLPDLQDGEPILVRDEQYTRLNPFKFYLVDLFQHWSVVDSQGKIVETSLDPEIKKNDKSKRWDEHVETVIIVIMPDGSLVPANCTFKTVKADAALNAYKELKRAANIEEWSKQSPEHKAASAVSHPYARFINTVTYRRGTSKGGHAFVAAKSFSTPTGMADWSALGEHFKGAEFKKLCEAVFDRYQDRVADLKAGA